MPFPRSCLDLIFIPVDKDFVPSYDDEKKFIEHAEKQRWINQHSAGIQAHQFLDGGFHSFRIERYEYPMLFANHQGGYQVRCPLCEQHIAQSFSKAISIYRKDRTRFELTCIHCSSTHPLDRLYFRPEAGFAQFAVVVQQVESIHISNHGHSALSLLIPNFKTIMKRVG